MSCTNKLIKKESAQKIVYHYDKWKPVKLWNLIGLILSLELTQLTITLFIHNYNIYFVYLPTFPKISLGMWVIGTTYTGYYALSLYFEFLITVINE